VYASPFPPASLRGLHLPDRIRFNVPIPPAQSAKIAAALVLLADDGYTVTVEMPQEARDLGWRVLLDAPGRHTSFRVRTDAEPAEWAAAVALAIDHSH
jgi:hypothetical protein